MLFKVLCPEDQLIQPSQKYGPMVTSVSYSYIRPTDARMPPNLPVFAFLSRNLFPNLRHLSLAGSPPWLNAELLISIAKSVGPTLKTLSLSGVTKGISDQHFGMVCKSLPLKLLAAYIDFAQIYQSRVSLFGKC